MMKRVLIYGVLFWVLGCYKAAGQEAIGLYDLHYTLETDLSTPKGRNVAWDDVHVVSALQGIVNRDAPQLYVFFVDRDQLDIDKYWLNKYRRKGQWLYRKETVTYNTIEDLVWGYFMMREFRPQAMSLLPLRVRKTFCRSVMILIPRVCIAA